MCYNYYTETKRRNVMIKLTPPMGWNSWNTFGNDINEELIMRTADKMVDEGLLDAGYEYLVIDDCWSEKRRDENGRLVADHVKFPHGMKYVADYVHSKGLKFGMYSCDGYFTCAAYPGSFDYEFIDAETFAEWGVDYLKYDNCYKPTSVEGRLLYNKMGLALENCGRDIMFSACNWGVDNVHEWIKETGAHLWRSTGDISDNWESVKHLLWQQLKLQPYNGIGCFNDMDMLIVGMHGKGNVAVGGCTDTEYKTHFSAWAMLNSPLMIGCDIREMSDVTKSILTNRAILEINQDAAGRQPYLISGDKNSDNKNQMYIFAKHLEGGDIAIGMFNMTDSVQRPWFGLADIGLDHTAGRALEITDLWEGKSIGKFYDIFRTRIEPHDCKMLRCKVVRADGDYTTPYCTYD